MHTTGSTTSDGSSSTANSTSSTIKHKKSRPRLVFSDDENGESDGAEADAECVGRSGRSGAKGAGAWVNMEASQKGLSKRSAAAAAVVAIEGIV